jgi:hypothetical protein
MVTMQTVAHDNTAAIPTRSALGQQVHPQLTSGIGIQSLQRHLLHHHPRSFEEEDLLTRHHLPMVTATVAMSRTLTQMAQCTIEQAKSVAIHHRHRHRARHTNAASQRPKASRTSTSVSDIDLRHLIASTSAPSTTNIDQRPTTNGNLHTTIRKMITQVT